MSKIIVAVSPEGVTSVAAHVCGPGFCVIPATDAEAAKHSLKYGESSSDANLMRRRMAELNRTGWKNVRVEDSTWLETRQQAPAQYNLGSDKPVTFDVSGDSNGR